MTFFLFDGPADAEVTVPLAHGARGRMDSASLNAAPQALATPGMRVVRFEFGYMAFRRASGSKTPRRQHDCGRGVRISQSRRTAVSGLSVPPHWQTRSTTHHSSRRNADSHPRRKRQQLTSFRRQWKSSGLKMTIMTSNHEGTPSPSDGIHPTRLFLLR